MRNGIWRIKNSEGFLYKLSLHLPWSWKQSICAHKRSVSLQALSWRSRTLDDSLCCCKVRSNASCREYFPSATDRMQIIICPSPLKDLHSSCTETFPEPFQDGRSSFVHVCVQPIIFRPATPSSLTLDDLCGQAAGKMSFFSHRDFHIGPWVTVLLYAQSGSLAWVTSPWPRGRGCQRPRRKQAISATW